MYGYGYSLYNRIPFLGTSGFDPAAQAFISAAGITDPTQQDAIDALVIGLKTDGLWTKMKAIYPFVGGTATTHKFNLKDPRDLDAAFRLVFNGGWTHSSNGAQGNGTNGFANTYLAPSQMSQNSIHISYYSRSNIQQFGMMGASNVLTDNIVYLNPRFTDGKSYVHANNSTGSVFLSNTETSSAAYFLIQRTTSTNNRYFKNGALINSGTFSSATPSNNSIYIGAANLVGQVEYSSRQCALATIGDGLTDTEASKLYTRVQAYQTALSRQV
jgi:hypothetical protein